MHSSTLRGVLEHLRKLTDPDRCRELSDGDLLDRFRLHREESAFTLLLQRHGPMVFNVCRRILGDGPEAEDAFQTAFLALIRRAGTIRKEAALSSWLHVVATHVAHKAAMQSAWRRACEREVVPPQQSNNSFDALAAAELRTALDEEIARLPDKYRIPLILCYLAEKTHEQAARELGWPKSSVTARLAKARQLLQQRLIRRGFTAPAGLLAALLTEQATNAALPSLLTLSTVRLAVLALNDEALAATTTAILTGSFAKGAVLSKWTATLALLATMGLAAVVGPWMAGIDALSKREVPALKSQAAGGPKAEVRKPRLDRFGDPLPDEVLTRILPGRMRHPGYVGTLAFSADGKSLVSGGICGDKGVVRVWDTTTGKLQRRLDTQADWCLTFALASDGIVVAGSEFQKGAAAVEVLDPSSGAIRRHTPIREAATAQNLALSPDGRRIALTQDKSVRLFETLTGKELLRIPMRIHSNWHMAFAPDSKTLAVANHSDAVPIYDVASGKIVRRLKRNKDDVYRVRFSPDGRFLGSIARQGELEKLEISIWDVAAGVERHRLKSPTGEVICAAFSPDNKHVATGNGDRDVVLWDMTAGKEIQRLSTDALFSSLAFSPDGKALAAASVAGTIRLWETATGRVLPASADPFIEAVGDLRFSADSRRLLGRSDACIAWDPLSGREIQRFAKVSAFARPSALSPDESLYAAAGDNGAICLWEVKAGRERRILKGHVKWVGRMQFSADSRRLISSGADATIRVWDVAEGRELHKLTGLGDRVFHLAMSPDGRWLSAANAPLGRKPSTITVWDLTTGKEKWRTVLSSISRLSFAPDSRSLAAVGGGGMKDRGEVKIWDVAGGQERCSLYGHKSAVISMAYSPDSRTLATGGLDGTLFLWELANGRKRHQFVGHESTIYSVAFSPNGRLLAAASQEAPIYIWDAMGTTEPLRRSLSPDELRRCWTALAGEDAVAAFEAIRRLAAIADKTMPFLRQHLKPVTAPDRKRVRQLVEALDSGDFQTRQKAAEELENQADAAASILRPILTKEKSSLEVRRRLQQICRGRNPSAGRDAGERRALKRRRGHHVEADRAS